MAGKFSTRYLDDEMATDLEVSDMLSQKQDITDKNQPFGYAGLGADGKILSSLIPPIAETIEVIEGGSPSSVYFTQDIDGGNP